MTVSEELTLGELVAEAEFGLTVVTGDLGLSRVIVHVHHSDLSDPTQWMTEGTLLITHGADLVESTDAANRYLDTISGKTSALVVAVGEYLDHVPPEAIDHAKMLGLPVVEAPRSLALRDIVSYVYHSLSSMDMHWLRRALAVQSQLLDLLVDEKGAAEIILRLSETLDLSMILFDPAGGILAVASRGDEFDIGSVWSTVEGAHLSGGPTGVIEAGKLRIYVRRVVVHGELTRVLVAVVPRAQVTSILIDVTLSHAQRLIGVSLLAEREAMRFRRNLTSALLQDLLSREEGAHDLTDKLQAAGIDLGDPWRVAVLGVEARQHTGRKFPSSPQERESILRRVADAAEEGLHSAHVSAISCVMEAEVIVLAVFEEAGREVVFEAFTRAQRQVQDGVPEVTTCIGVSGGWVGPSRPASLLRQAQEACRSARDGAGVNESIVLFDEADNEFRLLGGQSPDALAAMSDRLVRPLIEHDRVHHTLLVETLRAYFKNGTSVQETTRELFVHRNTLYKRLARIEAVLDLDLSRMDDMVELYVSFKAAELLAAASGTHSEIGRTLS